MANASGVTCDVLPWQDADLANGTAGRVVGRRAGLAWPRDTPLYCVAAFFNGAGMRGLLSSDGVSIGECV
jgi:hypothetical protein